MGNAKTDLESFDLTQIPLEGEIRLGKIFREGEIKYERNNWRNGVHNLEYQIERANHALKHLKIYVHFLEHGEYLGSIKDGEMEDDLAKVAWFCMTQMELERLEQIINDQLDEPSITEEEKKKEEEIKEEEPKKVNLFTKMLKGI